MDAIQPLSGLVRYVERHRMKDRTRDDGRNIRADLIKMYSMSAEPLLLSAISNGSEAD